MIKYIVKRVLLIYLIVLVIIFILFLLLYALPASLVRSMPIYGGGDALDSVFSFFNAGDNFFTKYIRYCYNVIVRFNFGYTVSSSRRLAMELSARLRTTLTILACGVGATLLIGVPLGAYSAVHKNSKRDRIINVVTLFFSAIPSYTIAFLLVVIFSLYLGLVPVLSSYASPVAYFLPTLTITLGGVALISRTTRTSMLEILEQPFITALRSKGLKERHVVYRHAFKSALITILSVLGGLIAQMLCGTFVVELFFNVPGLGSYMLRSVGFRDHIEMLGCTVIMAIVLATTNIIADVAYTFVNPQIRLRYTRGS